MMQRRSFSHPAVAIMMAPSETRLQTNATRFVLTVLEGPDRGRAVAVEPTSSQRLLIGTSPACDMRLSDVTVARRQCSLELDGEMLRLVDLGSSLATATRVGHVEVLEARLRGGETLRIGTTAIQVARVDLPTRKRLDSATSFGALLGSSTVMRRLYPLCRRIAASNVASIIEGEPGSGKSALAAAIHQASERRPHPFLVFDCSSAAPDEVAIELFGVNLKGSIQGVRRGLFERAGEGTVLLENVGDLPHAVQLELLRMVDRQEIRRIGSGEIIALGSRLLCTTDHDLEEDVEAATFEGSLLERLAVARIEMPPLCSRRSDIPVLAAAFATEMGASEPIPDDLLRRWEQARWAGNVRELRDSVRRYVASHERVAPPSSKMRKASSTTSERSLDFIDETLRRGMTFAQAQQHVQEHFARRFAEVAAAAKAASDADAENEASSAGFSSILMKLLGRRAT